MYIITFHFVHLCF